jgi:yecA family protein
MLVLTNMKQTSLSNYEELDKALHNTTLKLHPSQVHGIICGIFCGEPGSMIWKELVTQDEESSDTENMLQNLYTVIIKQLNDFLFEFQLLLPPDSEDLPKKAESLTLWCQGYLTGLKLTHVQIENREQSEMTEAINDLIEIAKMNYDYVVASEEDEVAYVELVEYVRMAVIVIYQDLRDVDGPKKIVPHSSHLH